MTTVATSPAVSSGCLSDLALDELVAGRSARDGEQRHLDACTRCAGRRAMFAESVSVADAPVSRLLAAARAKAKPVAARRWWGWPYALSGALAAAVAVMIVINRPGTTTDERTTIDDAGIRVKGVATRWFRMREGKVTAATSGDVFAAGDALSCSLTTGEPREFMLVGIDRRGERVEAYYPSTPTSIVLPAGVDKPLPNSLVLDDAPGPEYYVAIFAPTRFSIDDLNRELARARADGLDLEAAIARLQPGAARSVFVVRKE